MAPSGQLLRTAIEDRAIVLVAINDFDRAVGLHREKRRRPTMVPAANVHSSVSASKLLPSRVGMEDSADADLGMDLVGRDFRPEARAASLPSPLHGTLCV